MKKEGTGGSAIKDSISIDGETARFIANELVAFLDKEMIEASPLGSTGKKPKYMLSGFNVPNAIGACNSHSHNSNIIELFGTGNKVIYVTFNGFNLL